MFGAHRSLPGVGRHLNDNEARVPSSAIGEFSGEEPSPQRVSDFDESTESQIEVGRAAMEPTASDFVQEPNGPDVLIDEYDKPINEASSQEVEDPEELSASSPERGPESLSAGEADASSLSEVSPPADEMIAEIQAPATAIAVPVEATTNRDGDVGTVVTVTASASSIVSQPIPIGIRSNDGSDRPAPRIPATSSQAIDGTGSPVAPIRGRNNPRATAPSLFAFVPDPRRI